MLVSWLPFSLSSSGTWSVHSLVKKFDSPMLDLLFRTDERDLICVVSNMWFISGSELGACATKGEDNACSFWRKGV